MTEGPFNFYIHSHPCKYPCRACATEWEKCIIGVAQPLTNSAEEMVYSGGKQKRAGVVWCAPHLLPNKFIRLIFKRGDTRTYPTEELSHVDFVVVEIEIIGIIGIR